MQSEIDELKRRETAAESMLREARELREKAEKADRERSLDAFKPLAIAAHDALCRWNHTDGCGWGYEVRDGVHHWGASEHSRWLLRVAEIVTGQRDTYYGRNVPGIPRETVEAVIATVTELRKVGPDAIYLLKNLLAT